MYNYHTHVELSDTVKAEVDIVFAVTPRIPGTYYDPPEGGEIELEDVVVWGLEGECWEKDNEDLMQGGWLYRVAEIAWEKVVNELDGEFLDELFEFAEARGDNDF